MYLLRHVAHGGQHAQHVEEALVVVAALKRAACVAVGQLGDDVGRDEGGAEERHGVVGDGGLQSHCVSPQMLCAQRAVAVCVSFARARRRGGEFRRRGELGRR